MTFPDQTDSFREVPAPVPDERLDRQMRIPGWDQEALAKARVGVAGDDPWLTGLFIISAAALGINRLTVVAPDLDPRLLSAAQGINPRLNLAFLPGYFSHFVLEDLFRECTILVDLCHHGLATKLLLSLAHRKGLPLVRGYEVHEDGMRGVRLFTYRKGREWQELLEMMPKAQLPSLYQGDPVLALIAAGLILEETKKLLLGEPVTQDLVSYPQAGPAGEVRPGPMPTLSETDHKVGPSQLSPLLPPAQGNGEKETQGFSLSPGDEGKSIVPADVPAALKTENRKRQKDDFFPPGSSIAVVGAGALGNFVGLGLAALYFPRLTFIDPDPVEVTNLNRQILFWDAVGQPKAEALARRIKEWFGVCPRAETAYVTRETDLSAYAAVFDCTDNFASRIILSEKCREGGQILISGGTGVEAGQAVIFDPAQGGPTPAELLGLYDLVGGGDFDLKERSRASCVYAPDPAVIMTNQIIGGLMVDAFRRLLAGKAPPNLFYDARSERMFLG
jgi:molybdopterin/thiamine biosynthesis adenylyltransferase